MTASIPHTPHDPAMPGPERIPLPPLDSMSQAQRQAAEALIAGPRGAVFGPFIPLMQSPELLDRLQKVGEYLRFGSVLPSAVSEFAILVVSRQWSQQFEWCMHYPLALKAGVPQTVLDELAQGARPQEMNDTQAAIFDFCQELNERRGISDATYARLRALLDERGIVELSSLVGYFALVSMVMNVARTPPLAGNKVQPLASFPL